MSTPDLATIVYLAAAAACFFLAARAPAPRLGRETSAWAIVSTLLLLLGLLRPYPIHSRISGVLRGSAQSGGWYGERGALQLDLLLAAGFFGAVLTAFLLFETRRWKAATRIGMVATLYLIGLTALYILSLHGVDHLLGRRVGGVPLRWFLDLAGLATVAWAALAFRRRAAKINRKPPLRS